MRIAWLVPFAIAAFAALDALERFAQRFDVDVHEGDLLPAGACRWGTIRTGRNGAPGPYDSRYFALRLPSYDYRPLYSERLVWTQRVLIRAHGRWFATWAEPQWSRQLCH